MLPVNPVGAYIVPGTNRFMGFSGWGDNEFYLAEGMTQFVDYDFTTVSGPLETKLCPRC